MYVDSSELRTFAALYVPLSCPVLVFEYEKLNTPALQAQTRRWSALHMAPSIQRSFLFHV